MKQIGSRQKFLRTRLAAKSADRSHIDGSFAPVVAVFYAEFSKD